MSPADARPPPPDALPPALEALVDELAALPGARAVALGGSRAAGAADASSDWDFALYYRGALDTRALAARGTVHPPGAWGRIMNGGAWLSIEGRKVDVLLRDLDAVEHWAAQAERGLYEVDFLLSYLAGCPTYSLLAELALGRVLRGELPSAGGFPPALAAAAPGRWRFHRDFNLEHARARRARRPRRRPRPGRPGDRRRGPRAALRAGAVGAEREAHRRARRPRPPRRALRRPGPRGPRARRLGRPRRCGARGARAPLTERARPPRAHPSVTSSGGRCVTSTAPTDQSPGACS